MVVTVGGGSKGGKWLWWSRQKGWSRQKVGQDKVGQDRLVKTGWSRQKGWSRHKVGQDKVGQDRRLVKTEGWRRRKVQEWIK